MKAAVVEQSAIANQTRREMYELFASQFDGVPYAAFVRDLEDKNWVLLIRRNDGRLAAFSSMHLFDVTIGGRAFSLIYSGDTVVDSDTWSDSALSYYWMGAVDYLCRTHDKDRLYWFLLVSGYRTYRFLPVYSAYFFPRYDRATPPDIQQVMDTLASERFGERYDAATGIVRLDVPAILKAAYGGIPENRLADPHIAFFAERNPGHDQGDELVCFAALAEEDLTPLGRRMWRKGRKLLARGISE